MIDYLLVRRGSARGTNWLISAGERGSFVARVACVAHLLTPVTAARRRSVALGARTRATREVPRSSDELLPTPANAGQCCAVGFGFTGAAE